MYEATVSYTETLKAFANHKSLRDVGLYLLNQFDKPVNWFGSAADWSFGMAFQEFVRQFRQVAPKGTKPKALVIRWDARRKLATISLPSGDLAVTR